MFTQKILAQGNDIVGKVGGTQLPQVYQGASGLVTLLSNLLQLVFIAAGIYAFFNLIFAGFQFMSAGGDSKAIEKAWSKIWQSLLGLVIVVGSFALAALIGFIVFGRADYILNPKIYGPGSGSNFVPQPIGPR